MSRYGPFDVDIDGAIWSWEIDTLGNSVDGNGDVLRVFVPEPTFFAVDDPHDRPTCIALEVAFGHLDLATKLFSLPEALVCNITTTLGTEEAHFDRLVTGEN